VLLMCHITAYHCCHTAAATLLLQDPRALLPPPRYVLCCSTNWYDESERLRLRVFWALRSRDTVAGVSGLSSMPEVGRSSACRCPGTGGATPTTTSPPLSSTSSLSLGLQAPWSRVASSAWLFRPRSWPLHWPRTAAVRQPSLAARRCSGLYCFTVDGRRMLYDKNGSLSVRVATGLRSQWPLAVGGRLSTWHLSFVRSMRQRLPRSTPGQQPGTFGRGPPPQSGHQRQSISSLRC
jgi:hypothetical protein